MSAKQVNKTSTKAKTNTKTVKEVKEEVKVVEQESEKKTMSDSKKKKIVIACILSGVLLVILLMFIASYFRNFGEIELTTNNKDIFTVGDLTLNDLKYGDNEEKVKKELGKASKEENKTINNYEYKVLSYDGLTIYLKEHYNDFILSKVEITSRDYYVGRGIKVGTKITKVFRKFKIENSKGAYLYGNYTNNALTESEIDGNIYYGVRSNENVLYVNRDVVVEGLPTNIAKLNIEYKNGKVKKITWSYDIQ